MKVIFEAFDGTRFTDEDECKFYELTHEAEKVEKNIILLDQYGGIITAPLVETNLDKVFTIVVGNDKAAEFLANYFNETSTDGPWNGFEEKSVYWWDDEKMEWINVWEQIKKLEDEIIFFEEKLSLLQQI